MNYLNSISCHPSQDNNERKKYFSFEYLNNAGIDIIICLIPFIFAKVKYSAVIPDPKRTANYISANNFVKYSVKNIP